MRIVHFSDIHLSSSNLFELRQYLLKSLNEELEKLDKTKKINLIILTGDLLDKGGHSLLERGMKKSPFEIFNDEFILPICKHIGINKDHIIFIPGNHDVNEQSINWFKEKELSRKIHHLKNKHFELNKILKANIPSFKNSKRIEPFKKFEENFHKENILSKRYFYTPNQSAYIYKFGAVEIGFLLINDSWRCKSLLFKEENEELFFGSEQITDALVWLKRKGSKFNICLIHHDTTDYLEKIEIEKLFNREISIVLNGHYHEMSFVDLSKSNNNSEGYLVFKVGALLNKPDEKIDKFKPSFQVIDLDIQSGTVEKVKYFVYNYLKGNFDDISDIISINRNLPTKIPKFSTSNFSNLNINDFNDF